MPYRLDTITFTAHDRCANPGRAGQLPRFCVELAGLVRCAKGTESANSRKHFIGYGQRCRAAAHQQLCLHRSL
jgi:hypothetical protein